MGRETREKKSKLKNSEIRVRNEDLYFPLHRQIRLKNLKDDLKQIQENYNEKIDNLPKEFEYYCQACLYQTNEYRRVCPKCYEGRLIKTK